MSNSINSIINNNEQYVDEMDVPSFLRFKSNINIINKEECMCITRTDVDANVAAYNAMLNKLDSDKTIPIAIAHDDDSVVVAEPKWWSGIGRYILLAIICIVAMLRIYSIEKQCYYNAHYEWYCDRMSDSEFHSLKQEMWFF